MKISTTNKVAAITLLSAVTYIIINKARKKSFVAKIDTIIQSGTNESGTAYDLGSNDAFNENYWQNLQKKGSVNLMTSASVNTNAKYIHDLLDHNAYLIDHAKVVGFFQGIKSKSQLSNLSSVYLKTYGKKLWNDLSHIDDSILGIGSINEYLPQIKSKIESLPSGLVDSNGNLK